MKLIYCLLLLVCPYLTNAQQNKSLSVGRQIPALSFQQMYNYSQQTVDLKKTKAKLILLDFWATWCGSCLAKFPLLDSLRQVGKGSLEVILVNSAGTNDDLPRIHKLFTRLNKTRQQPLSLPVAYNDQQAKLFFPHKYLPHYVWLNQDLQVIAITDGEAVTAQNITRALAGKYSQLSLKKDDTSFNIREPFLTGTAIPKEALLHSSTLTTQIPGLAASAYSNQINDSLSTLRYTNASLLYLLFYAHNTLPAKNSIITKSTSLNALSNQFYCYELITAFQPGQQVRALMQQDLYRYFGIRARTELQSRDVYILQADSLALNKYATQGGPSLNTLNDAGDRRLQNRTLADLQQWLDKKMSLPVLNESSFSNAVDISLPETDYYLDALNSALLPFGLSLHPAQRQVQSFIIY